MNKTRQKGYGYKTFWLMWLRELRTVYLFLERRVLANNGILALKGPFISDEESWNLAEFHGAKTAMNLSPFCVRPSLGPEGLPSFMISDQWKVADTESLFPLLEDMPDYPLDRKSPQYR